MEQFTQYFLHWNAGEAIFAIFCFFFLIQFFYYTIIYIRIGFTEKKDLPDILPPVSIIICARNESRFLRRFLPSILEQDYPDYEVIVVNDCSSDDTDMVLKKFSALYPHLKTTFLVEDEKFSHGKKMAMLVGIKAAKNEWLLHTDADCYADGPHWLQNMARNFDDKTQLVLGYGGYKERIGLVNKIIRFDTMFIGLQYLTFAKAGIPYMGVGRNLAYRKSLFFENKGFTGHMKLLSGDDDLFVNKVANANNTKVEFVIGSHTRSIPKSGFKEWYTQKQRHLTTSPHYKKIHKALIGLEPLSRVLFYLTFIVCLLMINYPDVLFIATGILFFIRLILFHIVIYLTAKKLNERKLFLYSQLFDIVIPFVYMGLMLNNKFTKKRRWNY